MPATKELDTVFVYSGQGKQHIGMAEDLYKRSSDARAVFEEGSEAADINIARLCFEGPEEDLLNRSSFAQPAIVTVQRAATLDLKLQGVEEGQVAGHSLGEISASIESGAISFHDGVRLARLRGSWMEEFKKGSMAAVTGLKLDEVVCICDSKGVEVANINTETQIVIAGDSEKVDEAMAVVAEKGGRSTVLLGIDVPSHTSHMNPVSEKIAGFLQGIEVRDPKILFWTNVKAQLLSRAEDIRDNLSRQVSSTVQWLRLIQEMIENGGRNFYEIGPGRVQSGIIRKIDKSVDVKSLDL